MDTEVFKLKYPLWPLKKSSHLFVCQDGNERFDSKWLGPERIQERMEQVISIGK
jgi:hypothetical protein